MPQLKNSRLPVSQFLPNSRNAILPEAFSTARANSGSFRRPLIADKSALSNAGVRLHGRP